MNSMKKQKDMTLEDEPFRLEVVQGKSGEQLLYSSRKKEAAGQKQKWHSVVGMFGGEIKVRFYKEQYCIGTWDVRSMNQGKLGMVNLPNRRWKE